MRVYEFSKQSGVPSKELIELLKKLGFPVSNHMAVLSDEALVALNESMQGNKSATPESVKKASELPSSASKPTKKAVEAPAPTAKPVKKATEPSPVVEEKAPKAIESAMPTVAEVPKPQEATPVKKPAVEPAHVEKPLEKAAATPPALPQFIVEEMTVEKTAQRIGRGVSDIILALLKKGMPVTKNQLLSTKVIADLARSYGYEAVFPGKKVEAAETKITISQENVEPRMPVVVVMGHVDHGKTTLLDFIRKSRVAAKEKGGITQHLGAYEVETAHGGLVFLDTPGHEAFSKIRVRGIKAADVAVLVVAADDSVKPQTIEALKHAKSMDVPIIVAVNKIDKVDPQRVDVVKRDLMQYELVPEEWGGSTIFVPISAKVGTGIDQLLEIIALQAQIMELKANPAAPCRGFVLESKLEKGRGPVATVICQEGTIKIGDLFVCGNTQGKVTGLMDSFGKRVMSAGPAIPVLVSGFEDLASVGEIVEVVDAATYKKARATKGERRILMPKSSSEEGVINLIVKADGNASKEALLGALQKLTDSSIKGEKKLYLVHSGVGDINESDVLLATNTGSTILGLHVRVEPNSVSLAQKNSVAIKTYEIIYQLLEDVEATIKGSREILAVKQKIGEAEVRKVFDIKDLGVIAGSYIKEGKFVRDGSVVVWRDQRKVGQGKIKSLQREKRSMKEVAAGFECGFIVEGFNDWHEGDRVECFIEVPGK